MFYEVSYVSSNSQTQQQADIPEQNPQTSGRPVNGRLIKKTTQQDRDAITSILVADILDKPADLLSLDFSKSCSLDYPKMDLAKPRSSEPLNPGKTTQQDRDAIASIIVADILDKPADLRLLNFPESCSLDYPKMDLTKPRSSEPLNPGKTTKQDRDAISLKLITDIINQPVDLL